VITMFHSVNAVILMSLATLGWSLAECIGRNTVKYGDALTFNAIKLTSATLTLFITLSIINECFLGELPKLPWTILILVCFTGIITHLGNLIYYFTLKFVPLHIIAPIAHTDPYWTFFFAIVFLNESFDLRIPIAALLIIFGVRMLSKRSERTDKANSKVLVGEALRTALLGLGVSLCWALNTFLSKYCLKVGITISNLLLLKNTSASLMFLTLLTMRILIFNRVASGIKNKRFIIGSLGAGLCANVLGDLMFIIALTLTKASRISIYSSLILLYDFILSRLLLREKIGKFSIIGFVLITLAIIVVTI